MNSLSRSNQSPNPLPALDEVQEEVFSRFIEQRLGMEIRDHQRPRLRTAIEKACQKYSFPTFDAFLSELRDSSTTSAEWEFLVSQVTVGESYFFRDQVQFAFLRDEWLPALLRAKRQRNDFSLRIWSAGCSDGQELYSIAILLDQQLPKTEPWKVSLLGTDVNVEALGTAIKGRYSKWSFRGTPKDVIKRYFKGRRER
jgi:chemotaxis protein methyltransferase CheR